MMSEFKEKLYSGYELYVSWRRGLCGKCVLEVSDPTGNERSCSITSTLNQLFQRSSTHIECVIAFL